MGQLVQDGIHVSLDIRETTYTGRTKNGAVQFDLKQEDFPEGTYTFLIKTLGLEITKTITVD